MDLPNCFRVFSRKVKVADNRQAVGRCSPVHRVDAAADPHTAEVTKRLVHGEQRREEELRERRLTVWRPLS